MIEYKVGDAVHNVKAAVANLREAYSSNDTEKYAKQFTDAQDIIISAICFGGFTVCQEQKQKQTSELIEDIVGFDVNTMPKLSEYKCADCAHEGEKSVTGNCIRCRDFDRYEKREGNDEDN